MKDGLELKSNPDLKWHDLVLCDTLMVEVHLVPSADLYSPDRLSLVPVITEHSSNGAMERWSVLCCRASPVLEGQWPIAGDHPDLFTFKAQVFHQERLWIGRVLIKQFFNVHIILSHESEFFALQFLTGHRLPRFSYPPSRPLKTIPRRHDLPTS